MRWWGFPEYAPEVPEADRRMGDWCEISAVVTIGLILAALGSMVG